MQRRQLLAFLAWKLLLNYAKCWITFGGSTRFLPWGWGWSGLERAGSGRLVRFLNHWPVGLNKQLQLNWICFLTCLLKVILMWLKQWRHLLSMLTRPGKCGFHQWKALGTVFVVEYWSALADKLSTGFYQLSFDHTWSIFCTINYSVTLCMNCMVGVQTSKQQYSGDSRASSDNTI